MATIIRYAIQTIILAVVCRVHWCWTGAVFFVLASVCVAAAVWS